MIFFRLLRESVLIAFQELWKNKLRTFLSLIGITIGIFCIISVLSAVDSIEMRVQNSLQQMGQNVVFVQKWPWGGSEEYKWWEYLQRPVPKYEEYRALDHQLQRAQHTAMKVNTNSDIEYKSNQVKDVGIQGVTYHFIDIFQTFELEKGRYFSLLEARRGANSVILGHEVAQQVFPEDTNRLYREVRFLGHQFNVIGILKPKGKDMISFGVDEAVLIPYQAASKYINTESEGANPEIIVKGYPQIPIQDLKTEVEGVMRTIRQLAPTEEPNFALNEITMLSGRIESTFAVVHMAGWIIGGLAILVGGFGIANIMFVSVRERTNIIGIKKAIGAKKYIITLEFLTESVILCLVGGAFGLLTVFLIFSAVDIFLGFPLYLTWQNFILGLLISVFVGIVAGFWPAFQAAQMDPVSAIRF